jgi:hypothetical protein
VIYRWGVGSVGKALKLAGEVLVQGANSSICDDGHIRAPLSLLGIAPIPGHRAQADALEIHFDRLNKRRIANTKPAIPKTITTGIANTPSAETEYPMSGPQ